MVTSQSGQIPKALGIDVNGYFPVKDWKQMMGAGIKFLGIKATEGRSHVDSCLARHRDVARTQPLSFVSYYHFARPEAGVGNAIEQAHTLVTAVGQLANNESLCLDLERGLVVDPKLTVAWASEFITAMLGGVCSGRHHLMYTSERIWKMLGDQAFPLAGELGLWIPRYSPSFQQPVIPPPWKNQGYDFWQWGDGKIAAPGQKEPFNCPGVGRCDVNWFKGDDAALAAYGSNLITQT